MPEGRAKCVLYLAEHSGASNGQIARAIGVGSHTQISTLLGRLQKEGVMLKRPVLRVIPTRGR